MKKIHYIVTIYRKTEKNAELYILVLLYGLIREARKLYE